MRELYYTENDIALIIRNLNLKLQSETELLEKIWESDQEYLCLKLRNSHKEFVTSILSCIRYYDDKPTIDAEFPQIENDLKAVGCKVVKEDFIADDQNLDLFFKNMKIKLQHVGSSGYSRLKLRTLLSHYGYKRRTLPLVRMIKTRLYFYHISTYRGKEECDIEDIKLDDMITFRIL